jgi:SagB-type dehydrogenase family enzyme
MDKETRLFVVAYAFPQGEATHFLFPGREVIIEGAEEVLPALLRLCNGYRTAECIISLVSRETAYEETDLWEVVEKLFAHGVFVEATQYYSVFHEASANPMPFWHELSEEEILGMVTKGNNLLKYSFEIPLTPVEQLLAKRESIRKFTGELLSQDEIGRLAWAMYGKASEFGTVPSGGALYPLRLFVLTPSQEQGNWNCFEAHTEGLVSREIVTNETLVHGFLDDANILESVGAVYVLVCDFLQTTQKYANRGYRYALLEAGHAAQNAYFWCAEQGIGVVEIGGFNDKVLSDLLLLSYPREAPLTTLLVGRRKF